MQNISLVLSNTYICKGKVYKSGINYEVSEAEANHLLAQRNERNLRYFRLVSAASTAPAMHAGDKPNTATPAADAEESVVVESVVDTADEPVELELEETDEENPQLRNPKPSTGSLEDADDQVEAPVAPAKALVEDDDDDPIVLDDSDLDPDPEVGDDADIESEV